MNAKACKRFRHTVKVMMAKWPVLEYTVIERQRVITVTNDEGKDEQRVYRTQQRVLDKCQRKAYKNIKNAYRKYKRNGGYGSIRGAAK